ncbi:hypothetical protein [Methanosarcina sp. KYL-1]|uniref:hypothetical protein n=1 Tax=Methanosarcina sp. KYL-1 TaxID=2602068 RepID=UPI002100E691|nr:hypothetical protein [Methanosarcina sp. KYL-1]
MIKPKMEDRKTTGSSKKRKRKGESGLGATELIRKIKNIPDKKSINLKNYLRF